MKTERDIKRGVFGEAALERIETRDHLDQLVALMDEIYRKLQASAAIDDPAVAEVLAMIAACRKAMADSATERDQ